MQIMAKRNVVFILSSLFILGMGGATAQWKWKFLSRLSLHNNVSEITNFENRPPLFSVNHLPDESGNMREILSANLFGQENTAAKAVVDIESVPKTQLPLELQGVVFKASHPEQSVVLIAQVGAAAKDYKAGDMIDASTGWKVHAILPEAVKIEHEGTIELLELPKNLLQVANGQAVDSAAIQVENTKSAGENMQDEAPPPPQDNQPQAESAAANPPVNPAAVMQFR